MSVYLSSSYASLSGIFQAAESLLSLVSLPIPPELAKDFYNLLVRLSRSSYYTARMNSCWFFPFAFLAFPEKWKEIVFSFTDLCRDPIPEVRKNAAVNLLVFNLLVFVI